MTRAAASLALPAALLLGACAQAPVHEPPASQDTSGSIILTVEEVANIRFPEPRVEMDGSSGSARRSPDWLWARSELSETQARLGVDPLWKRCRPGEPEEYGFVHARALAWASDEDDYRLRLDGDGGERVHRGRHAPDDDSLDFRMTVEREALDTAKAKALLDRMKALEIDRLPAAIDRSGCHDSPVQAFESCVDGRYRMTYDSCPSMRPDDPQNAFHRAIALLRDGAAAAP